VAKTDVESKGSGGLVTPTDLTAQARLRGWWESRQKQDRVELRIRNPIFWVILFSKSSGEAEFKRLNEVPLQKEIY
jgi:hypothetical protein